MTNLMNLTLDHDLITIVDDRNNGNDNAFTKIDQTCDYQYI